MSAHCSQAARQGVTRSARSGPERLASRRAGPHGGTAAPLHGKSGMSIKVTRTALPEVKIVESDLFCDEAGSSFETFNADEFAESVAGGVEFVQDDHSRSKCGVLRGLHYQIHRPQGKLMRVVVGDVFDVAVDIRLSSHTFGKWIGVHLSAANRRQMWVPPGFAHGFVVMSDMAECLCRATDYWYPEHERSILWSDPDIGIDWPIEFAPILAPKDEAGKRLYESEFYA
jgi:dTDP-4-dehydrorhamnose 3,5-epimerase